MESFTNSCRLCLWKGDKMIPIFTSPDDDETASKIRKCLPLDVRWEDNLPKGICASCLYKVEMLYEFHCSSVRIDSLLRKYLMSELKEAAFREQQLNSSGYQTTGVHLMRSVAIGTEDEDEYMPLARTVRDGRRISGDAEPMVPRVRVRTPFDISDMSSFERGSEGRPTTMGLLAHRSDSTQGIDSAGIHATGATEQPAASSTVFRLSISASTFQQEDSGQPEPEAHMSSQGESYAIRGSTSSTTMEDAEVVCLSVKSSPTATQNDRSTSQSCVYSSSSGAEDDEVVVLAEYQKPSHPHRRSRTPTPFDSSRSSTPIAEAIRVGLQQKTTRLCARHQKYMRLMTLQQEQQQQQQQQQLQQQQQQQQQGVPQQETLQGADQLSSRSSGQMPSANTSSTSPKVSDASRPEQCGPTQQAAQDQSPGGGTRHMLAESDSSHTLDHLGQIEKLRLVTRTKPQGATEEAVSASLHSSTKCRSPVPEPQDRVKQHQETAIESLRVKPCDNRLSSADAPSSAAAPSQTVVSPSVAAASSSSQVPPPSPATTATTAPPPLVVLTRPITTKLVPSVASLENPVTTQAATPLVPPVVTSSVTWPTGTSQPSRTASHSTSPITSPSDQQSPSTSQTSSGQKRSPSPYQSATETKSRSPSAGRGRSSKPSGPAATARPSASPTPSAHSTTDAPPPLAPLTTSATWPSSGTPTPSPAPLRTSPQLQQLLARGPANSEHQVIPAKVQDGLFKIPAFLFVSNSSVHSQTQPEQEGKVSATTQVSAQSLASATIQAAVVPKEEEQKQQLAQARSPGEAISQLLKASALISPPRGTAEPEQEGKKPEEGPTKSPGTNISQLVAAHLPAPPPHSCAQHKQHEQRTQVQSEHQKNRQQVTCEKLSAKTGGQPAASQLGSDKKSSSAQTGETLSGANQQLTNSTTANNATSHLVVQSSKRKKEYRSHTVMTERLPTPAEFAVASSTSDASKQIKQKHRTTQSSTERSLLKPPLILKLTAKSSTEIAEKVKQTPQLPKNQLSGGTVEEHQTTRPPALQNCDVSQKWKKKKKKKKEKEEEGSRHRSSNKSQQEPQSQKNKQPRRSTQQPEGDPSPQPAPTSSAQQIQKTETTSQQYNNQSQPVTTTFDLNGGEAEQPQVERWRNVQQDAVDSMRAALRAPSSQPPPPAPAPTPATSPPYPSAAVTSPPPPKLTPQRLSGKPLPPTSPSPPPPMLPPAVSATPSTDRPNSADPRRRRRSVTSPSSDKSFPAPFVTPPDAVDKRRSRSQPPTKAAAETGERRLRTPSPATSTGSGDWPPLPHRIGTPPRRYYNRKRKYHDLGTGETSEVDRDSSDSTDRSPPAKKPLSQSAPQPAARQPAQTPAAHPEPHGQPVPSAIALPALPVPDPVLPRSADAYRYSCRYCHQLFHARILLSLHRVNGACELHRSHNYARGRGRGDRPQVTERELMLAARVRLERIPVCLHCSRVLSSESKLRWHISVRHSRSTPRDTRSSQQLRWQSWTSSLSDLLPPPSPLLLPSTGRLSEGKDTVLEALGLTRKT